MGSGPSGRRRDFLEWFLAFSGLGALASFLYPLVRFLQPPEAAESTASSVVAASVEEIPVNGFKIFQFGSKPGILVRTGPAAFSAFSAKCSHLDCIVQYKGDERNLWCACHNGRYDLTGKNVSGPPPRPLEAYVARVLGDKVVVSKA